VRVGVKGRGALQRSENRANPCGQPRHILLNHLPRQIHVDPEVLMNEDVRSGNLAPRHVGMLAPEILWKTLHRFSNDLEAACHGILLLDVVGKLLARQAGRISLREVQQLRECRPKGSGRSGS